MCTRASFSSVFKIVFVSCIVFIRPKRKYCHYISNFCRKLTVFTTVCEWKQKWKRSKTFPCARSLAPYVVHLLFKYKLCNRSPHRLTLSSRKKFQFFLNIGTYVYGLLERNFSATCQDVFNWLETIIICNFKQTWVLKWIYVTVCPLSRKSIVN